jgi:hypothetical protein
VLAPLKSARLSGRSFSQGWQWCPPEAKRKDYPMTNTTEKTAKPPVAKIRAGLLNADIWERKTESGTFYSATFQRRYRDSNGKWHSTQSFDHIDLLALSKLADQAHSKIAEIKAAAAE